MNDINWAQMKITIGWLKVENCECRFAYLIPPTKILFGINVPYFGPAAAAAANCASKCPAVVFVTAIFLLLASITFRV